jgi:DNA-binding SARP family transcriptional activator
MVKMSLPVRRLLAYLAVRGGQVSRQQAVDELWPDSPEDVGRTNLRRSLWQVPQSWIAVVGETLILESDCDLPQARRSAARAIEGEAITFDEIDLISHDLLPGWHEDWVVEAHEEFRVIRVQALEAACRTLSNRGNHPLAIQAGAAAVSAEPLRESASEALIEAHLAQHNRFEALRAYRALAERLEYELGVQPHPVLANRLAELGLTRLVA